MNPERAAPSKERAVGHSAGFRRELGRFDATMAVPGSREKLDVLAARARDGLPLWHENDRADYDEPDT